MTSSHKEARTLAIASRNRDRFVSFPESSAAALGLMSSEAASAKSHSLNFQSGPRVDSKVELTAIGRPV